MSRGGRGAGVAWEVDLASLSTPPPRGTRASAPTTTPTTMSMAEAPAQGIDSTRRLTGRSSAPGAAPVRPSALSHGTTTLPRLAGSGATSRGGAVGGAGGPRAGGVPAPRPHSLASAGGADRPAPGPPSSARAIAPLAGRPSTVVASLHAPPRGTTCTAKGRAIRADLAALGDEYYAGVESSAPVPETRAGAQPVARASFRDGSPLARERLYYTEEAVPPSWMAGPRDSAGRVFDASDRNLLCMDVLAPAGGGGRPPVCVTGSADHGLRVFDLATLRERRTLFSRTAGHTEWVTSCKFLDDGRVLSGGMDSKLCLWDSVYVGGAGGSARCQDLLGHTGSIAQVDVNANARAISAAYDRTLRVWDCSAGRGREVGVLAGHKAPVLQFDWCGTQLLSGDRQGQARLWDVLRATSVSTMATKRGQVGAVRQFFHPQVGELAMLGDQGGVLTVLDTRQGRRPVHEAEVHPGGVVSGIEGVHPCSTGGPYVVTCGADKRICVLDPRRSFEPVHTFLDHTDFIYSMKVLGPLVVSGAGNGWLLVHDVRTGKCHYGLGAGTNAVREIFAAPDLLVAAGDDGKAVVYDYTD